MTELEKLGLTVIDLSGIDDSSSGSHSKFAGSPEMVQLIGAGLNSVGGVAGVEPLQQYLLSPEPGRTQTYDIAWDAERERWYPVFPAPILPRPDRPMPAPIATPTATRPGRRRNWPRACPRRICRSSPPGRWWSACTPGGMTPPNARSFLRRQG